MPAGTVHLFARAPLMAPSSMTLSNVAEDFMYPNAALSRRCEDHMDCMGAPGTAREIGRIVRGSAVALSGWHDEGTNEASPASSGGRKGVTAGNCLISVNGRCNGCRQE
jgi:hypothetical protein